VWRIFRKRTSRRTAAAVAGAVVSVETTPTIPRPEQPLTPSEPTVHEEVAHPSPSPATEPRLAWSISGSQEPAVLDLTPRQCSPLVETSPILQRATPDNHLRISVTDDADAEKGQRGDHLLEHEKPRFYSVDSNLISLSDCGRLSVVGESFYQEALRIVAGNRAFGYNFDEHYPVAVVLVPEPENPHDANAVRVDVLQENRSLKVGYLSREVAKVYQPILLVLRKEGFLGNLSRPRDWGWPKILRNLSVSGASRPTLFGSASGVRSLFFQSRGVRGFTQSRVDMHSYRRGGPSRYPCRVRPHLRRRVYVCRGHTRIL
jgi:hypothetical protein